MNRPKAATAAVRDFVVETEAKEDGRKIHYYTWSDPPSEPAEPEAARKAPVKPARTARRRV